jgi:uncharacterized lipoprotein NlpE involved in copper resistance
MKKLFSIVVVCTVLIACNNNAGDKQENKNTSTVSSTESKSDDSKSSLDWAGTYTGTVPCADCAGIATELMLHDNSTYMLSEKYLGKKDTLENKMEGKFKWLDGSVIELEGITSGPSKYFVAEGKLLKLDMQGNKVEGALADKYILQKSN